MQILGETVGNSKLSNSSTEKFTPRQAMAITTILPRGVEERD
jgi:hypothetical protein